MLYICCIKLYLHHKSTVQILCKNKLGIMANVKLITRSNKNPSRITLRFVAPGGVDIFYSTLLEVNPSEWSNEKSNYKNLSTIKDRVKKQARIERLKSYIIAEYSEAIMTGEVIDREWIKEIVSNFFNRPKFENRNKIKKHLVYFSDFCQWWLKEMAPKWKTDKNTYLSESVIGQYENSINIWNDFYDKKNLKIKDIDRALLGQYIDYLESKDYSSKYIKRSIGRIRFFLNRAKNMGIEVDASVNEKLFVSKDEQIIDPYLNEHEIDLIYNFDLSHDEILDNIRDSFIIGLWTGLRISDFNNSLDVSNIDGDYFKIKTQKTNTWVVVPIHPYIKKILSKRNGKFPKKYSDSMFNKSIKTICMLANIDQEIRGRKIKVINNERRKVTGNFKKWELVTSHICRRSFATNLHGVINNDLLAELCGWSDTKMMLHYIKRTKKESADVLRQTWIEKYKTE